MRFVAAVALGALAFCVPAQAQDSVVAFYKGKTVSLVVSSSAGGGYDLLARTVARHLPKHIPGSPTIAVRNMPGAGGIVATNYVYNLGTKDGLTIGGVQNNTPFEPLLAYVAGQHCRRRPQEGIHGVLVRCQFDAGLFRALAE